MTSAIPAVFLKPKPWDTDTAFQDMKSLGMANTRRTAERWLNSAGIWPRALAPGDLRDESGNLPTPSVLRFELDAVRAARGLALFTQLAEMPGGRACLHANDGRGARLWHPLDIGAPLDQAINQALTALQSHAGKPITIFPHGELTGFCRTLLSRVTDAAVGSVQFAMLSYPSVLSDEIQIVNRMSRSTSLNPGAPLAAMTHLDHLEAEAVFLLREAVSEARNPVMMYSIGKDSAVLMHLARKAFFPDTPPFALLHIDSRWKFREMYLFRDAVARQSAMELIVHTNPEAIEKNINPFDHGSALHTDITKTEGLKQALNEHDFDVIFGGARRDEEKSRAKERMISFRNKRHHWDPKNQRPELWNVFNLRKNTGESLRVFPLSNWTELDIWRYILRESIPVVPLYFARERPVVERDGMLMLVDDDRLELLPGEKIQRREVRFRSLGCYPLTGAVESGASTLEKIVPELVQLRNSERLGRRIDTDGIASMERKKQEGYF